jgi:hypothetical protein
MDNALYAKIGGAYAGSVWYIVTEFEHNEKTKCVAESATVRGLLHILDRSQLERIENL